MPCGAHHLTFTPLEHNHRTSHPPALSEPPHLDPRPHGERLLPALPLPFLSLTPSTPSAHDDRGKRTLQPGITREHSRVASGLLHRGLMLFPGPLQDVRSVPQQCFHCSLITVGRCTAGLSDHSKEQPTTPATCSKLKPSSFTCG